MAFLDERADFEDEIDAYYRTCPNDVSEIREQLDAVAAAHPSWSPFRLKALVYEAIAERCPVRVFRHFPFAFEVGVGKVRTDLGAGGIGGWLKTRPRGRELLACGSRWWEPWSRAGRPVFNEVTRLVIEAYAELGLVDPKLNARVSAAHPDEYFALLAGLSARGCNSLSVFNDDVVIAANQRMGKALFERGLVPMAQLLGMLADDFAEEEPFRQHLAQRIPKYGQENEAIRGFAARVFADVAAVSDGLCNTRGGRYEASLFAFRSFVHFGEKTGATPDGRRAGEHLSPGMSPSLLSLGRECSVSQVLGALEPLDMTDYPVVAVLDAKLPVSRTRQRPEVVAAVLRCFVEYGGSVLQLNVVDPQTLVEARQHPERHPDLVVRISGYSAYFRTLSPALQDEVIERTLATA